MAITQTGSILQFAQANTNNSGTISTTITVPSDAEIVIVGVTNTDTTTNNFLSNGSMTFTKGGVDTTMTAVQPTTRGDGDATFMEVAMFYLVLPDTGANKTLKYDWSGTGTCFETGKVSITFWKGIDTNSPVRGSGGGQASAPAYTTNTITAASGDLIVAYTGCYTGGSEGTASTWSNLSTLGQLTVNGQLDGAWATGSPSGNTTVALSTGTNFQDGGIVAISLKPAAGDTPLGQILM